MKFKNKAFKIYILLFLLVNCQNNIFSQISVNSYVEAGSNNVSDGIYSNFSTQISDNFGSIMVTTGALLQFSKTNPDIFSAYLLRVENDFKISNCTLNISAFYLWKPFSTDLREINFGVLVHYRAKHFGYQLGLNSRNYYFTNAARTKFNFADSIKTSIWEPINLMYRLSFYQSIIPKWNFEASVTNFDNYIIEQETNPMILTKFTYQLNNKMLFYSDLGYKQAGLLNIRVNYFGMFVRGGVIWRIN